MKKIVILSAVELVVYCVGIVFITLHHLWPVVLAHLGGCLVEWDTSKLETGRGGGKYTCLERTVGLGGVRGGERDD